MSTPRTSIAFHTMGCKTNFSETSTISSEMLSHGYKKVSYKDKADIYVLNTCISIHPFDLFMDRNNFQKFAFE